MDLNSQPVIQALISAQATTFMCKTLTI